MNNTKNPLILPTTIISIKNFLTNSVIFFLPIYFANIGFSGFQIGIILSVFAVTSLLSSVLIGLFSDRYPVKYLSIISFMLLTVYTFGLSTSKNFWIILLLFTLGGLGNNISNISLTSFVLKLIKRKNAKRKLGIFNSTIQVISGIGALVGGLFIAKTNFTNIFLTLSILFLITTIFSFFIKKIDTFKYSIEHYKGDLWKKEIIYFIIIIFIFTLHWGAEGTSYALLLKNNFKLSQTSLSLYLGSMWILYGFLIYFVSRFSKKQVFTSKILYTGLILSGLGHIAFVYPTVFYSYTLRLVHELGDAILFMFIYLGIHFHFPSERIGGTSGAILTITVLGRFVGSFIFGPIGDIYGYQYPFIISGILTLLCLIVAVKYTQLVKLTTR
jgi:MFS family permease